MAITTGAAKWVTLTPHRAWLLQQADSLLAFFERHSIDPRGGFFGLDDTGIPLPPADQASRYLHAGTRMVHCYAIASLLGRPGADVMIDHGMAFIWNGHRDTVHGGYFWGIGDGAPTDDTKQAYGHAFVLLAASSAKVAGHPDADRLLSDISTVLAEHFWDDTHGAAAEQFTRDWQTYDGYRGQNANMHLTEALMAAFEATHDNTYLRMAERIAELIIHRHAAQNHWHIPEHFDAAWQPDRAYVGNPTFRPYGTTPGHSLEWSRLLLQLWELGDRRQVWLPEAAKSLFQGAVTDGWDPLSGGFRYTLDWDRSPRVADRYHWPCCEGIGGAAFLNAIDGNAMYEAWYRRIWNFVATYFIDRTNGGWYPQLDAGNKPNNDLFSGKPDLYHALQACLIPLLPTTGSITRGLLECGVRL
jgi:mannose/cellobiose epimerase-like protein (N-acyl-D-glucosamine 2-epimerase family)